MPHNLQPAELESKSMIKRHVDKFRRRVWLRKVCYGFMLFAIAAIVALVGLPDQRKLFSPFPLEHNCNRPIQSTSRHSLSIFQSNVSGT